MARQTAWVRFRTTSFERKLLRWCFIVTSLNPCLRAISLFNWPESNPFKTSRSRPVSHPWLRPKFRHSADTRNTSIAATRDTTAAATARCQSDTETDQQTGTKRKSIIATRITKQAHIRNDLISLLGFHDIFLTGCYAIRNIRINSIMSLNLRWMTNSFELSFCLILAGAIQRN